LRPPHFGSIIDVLRHVPDRPLDLQCTRVLMKHFENLSICDAAELATDTCIAVATGAPSDRLTSGLGRRPMNVKTILSLKGSHVTTIEPTATLEAAVALLAKHRIGALVVLGADERVIGILSERDIVRALAELGASALTTPLAQVMTRKVVTCGEAETIAGLMEQMTTGKFRHVPVLEQDRLVGIVSIGDVVKQRLSEIEHESAALRDYIQTA
jgi:CBS domain-containing protein